jgi:hypothetical protein
MGRTSTANREIIKNRKETYSRQLSVCWELNQARVKASKHEYYLVYILKIFESLHESMYHHPMG